ncbi:hypothetical protein WI61_34335 [Burkholderia cepacia]|uniref:hypothetical protein n=1 Tax=Burkholderia cepacia TaxID=292 RepID=UPI00075E6B1F|nr:hypothetical protein [Burkholderia cepacia]KVA51610.1 hypothetical protein WI47_15075 [Burkholderia cepacia]KVA57203.1 hypothetical protein WI49_30265 [Burkholderia cepacia]KVA60574.1 hypothetical protein WI48_12605 [Burkholderia cepacia]KVA85051.1 hypothetical protein WI51_01080 [Burkholderia cepacia]KVA88349.1 hypothetical protein WI52_11290 [Burkholderia cepacia]
MAASELVSIVAQASATWLTPAALGALGGALITAVAGLMSQHLARRHENAKITEQRAYEHAKLADERARAQQEAMRPLEAFAKHGDEVLSPIEAAFEDYGDVGNAVFGHLKPVALHFDIPPQPIMDALPRPLVDRLYQFALALEVRADWLDQQELRFEPFDVWKLELQRVVHFGLLACNLTNELRRDLGLPESEYLKAWQRHFDAAFVKLQREYDRDPTEYPLMPEIEARLTSFSQRITGR